MKLAETVAVLEDLVPPTLAESWDNVGLLLGDPSQEIGAALLCIDATPAVLAEARRLRCELLIAYHPPIFQALKRLHAGSMPFEILRHGMACWSPHSALDVAEGGTSDVLAEALGLANPAPLRRAATTNANTAPSCKLVTFVPEESLEAVASAIFDAGAGVIGQYQSCSFRLKGTGTFLGGEGSSPRVGEKGRFEEVDEIRLEAVAPLAQLGGIVTALRRAHPYEEPAFDLVALHAAPRPSGTSGPRGLGRIGYLAAPCSRADLLARVKSALSLEHLLVAGPAEGIVERAACGPGACGDLWEQAVMQGAGFYLTGEMRHHDALAAAAAGLTVACTLHSNSERAALPRLADRLRSACPSLGVHVSEVDADPFEIR